MCWQPLKHWLGKDQRPPPLRSLKSTLNGALARIQVQPLSESLVTAKNMMHLLLPPGLQQIRALPIHLQIVKDRQTLPQEPLGSLHVFSVSVLFVGPWINLAALLARMKSLSGLEIAPNSLIVVLCPR